MKFRRFINDMVETGDSDKKILSAMCLYLVKEIETNGMEIKYKYKVDSILEVLDKFTESKDET